jgi:Predicted membrane protein
MNTQKITFLGLLTTLALLATYIEYLVPSPIPAISGIKLGLANVIILSLFYLFDGKTALCVNILRILLASLMFAGFTGAIYALSGGLLSFSAMYFAKRSNAFSIIGVSIIGATFHNIGQLSTSIIILQNKKLLYYLPVLSISALITGLIIGYLSLYLVHHLHTFCKKFV